MWFRDATEKRGNVRDVFTSISFFYSSCPLLIMPRKRSRKSLSTQVQPLKKRTLKKKRKETLTMEGKKTRASNCPRLSPEDRLKSRFYEPLVLLHILDRSGQRISRCPSEDPVVPQLNLREFRRTFLDQLAYICDFVKGGDTVTAMALEAQPSGVTFWVASNTEPSTGTLYFLQGILNTLQSLASSGSEHSRAIIEYEIGQKCIEFNLKRVKAYQTLARKPLQQCLVSLKSSELSEGE